MLQDHLRFVNLRKDKVRTNTDGGNNTPAVGRKINYSRAGGLWPRAESGCHWSRSDMAIASFNPISKAHSCSVDFFIFVRRVSDDRAHFVDRLLFRVGEANRPDTKYPFVSAHVLKILER